MCIAQSSGDVIIQPSRVTNTTTKGKGETMTGKIEKRFSMDLKMNGMNSGYGYFLCGTQSILDGVFLGTSKNEAELSIMEINQNRRLANLPEIKTA